jgi:hypothetical protein
MSALNGMPMEEGSHRYRQWGRVLMQALASLVILAIIAAFIAAALGFLPK